MPWIEPELDWKIEKLPTPDDFLRIENDLKHLKEEDSKISGNNIYSGNNTHSGNNSFTGDNVYNGEVNPDDSPAEGQTVLVNAVATLLPRGLYNIHLYARSNNNSFLSGQTSVSVEVEIKINGTWYTISSDSDFDIGGATLDVYVAVHGLISSGSNIRVTASGWGTAELHYYEYTKL